MRGERRLILISSEATEFLIGTRVCDHTRIYIIDCTILVLVETYPIPQLLRIRDNLN
jgi:hypothetical protein